MASSTISSMASIANMAPSSHPTVGIIKIEDSPSPVPSVAAVEPAPPRVEAAVPADPKDPEGFLKRCSGYNKKTRVRCSVGIGKKTQQNTHPTFLPTCSAHRDQHGFAGWCQFKQADGERCGRLFRWTPPYFELCSKHQGHPDTPCYFLKLPLELRHEIFRYLLPTKPIGSSTAALHDGHSDQYNGPRHPVDPNVWVSFPSRRSFTAPFPPPPPGAIIAASTFPMRLLDLFLVNRQVYHEAKDLLFSITSFTIDIRKDGTFMCGRRLLEPRRADGTSHFLADEADGAKEKFLKAFDWAAVKNYSVDILLENWSNPHPNMAHNSAWDEEVEIYDIRDYVSVVVSGILAKSLNLCKLQVRLCLADFQWSEEQIMENTKLIISPFERLRNVRQPHVSGVFEGRPYHNAMLSVQRPQRLIDGPPNPPPICSVPQLPVHNPVLIPGMPIFDTYTAEWGRWVSSTSSAPVIKKAPIRAMFTEFKDFYTKLSNIVPGITQRNGRHAFLHRARVAREQEDVESFRHLRNELIGHWYDYLDLEEAKKKDMNARISRMLDTDVYPSHEWEESASPIRRNSEIDQDTVQSPVLLNAKTMAEEGIPMTGNSRNINPLMHMSIPGSLSAQQTIAMRQQMQAAQMAARQAMQRAQPLACFNSIPPGPAYIPPQQTAKARIQQQQAMLQQQQQQKMQAQMLQQQQQQMANALHLSPTSQNPMLPPMSAAEDTNRDLYNQTPPLQQLQFTTANGIWNPPTNDTPMTGYTSSSPKHTTNEEVTAQPGPSSKRRRMDSGFVDMLQEEADGMGGMGAAEQLVNAAWQQDHVIAVEDDAVPYVGKGKGKVAQREVVCLD